MGRRGHRSRGGGDILMTAQTISQDTKERIRELEGQKIMLEDRLEHLGYSGNLVRMHEIEEEIFEIEDTIQKLIK